MPIPAEELSKLVDEYWGTLTAWVGPYRADAEDIAQAAFIKLASQPETPENPLGWLLTVTKRLAINEHKSQVRRISREAKYAVDAESAKQDKGSESPIEVEEQLSALGDEERQIVVAHLWGDQSFASIAELLGRPKSSVWKSYRQAIKTLKSLNSKNSGSIENGF